MRSDGASGDSCRGSSSHAPCDAFASAAERTGRNQSNRARSGGARRRKLRVRVLGVSDYRDTWRAMRDFTDARGPDTPDELWMLQHPPVFTLGQAGRREHLLATGDIPVVQTDRGGQVTYHGPGQLVAYLLLDLRRAGIGVKQMVNLLEDAVIDVLAEDGIRATARADAPGVYIDGAKIASVGLRVRRGCSYHGIAVNVDMDLEPFRRINPCGHAGLSVTMLSLLRSEVQFGETANRLAEHIERLVSTAAMGPLQPTKPSMR